ncbi:MAG: Omp28-related outer membrane protein [Bacteroidia bacterium]
MRKAGLFCLLTVFVFWSCEEEPPYIKFTEKPLLDTAYLSTAPAAQDKRVLVMDVTGVRCNNCPRATKVAEDLVKQNPGRVEALALYASSPASLTRPWPDFDTLSNADATQIISSLGSVISLPIGSVDYAPDGTGNRLVAATSWPLMVQDRLKLKSIWNLELRTEWQADEDRGRLEIKAIANQDFSGSYSWVIGIVESKIIGKQSDVDAAGGYTDEYEHNHVLRKTMGSALGDAMVIPAGLNPVAGLTIEKHLYVPRRYNWKAENLSAMVWIIDNSNGQVVQVAHADF